MIGVDSSARYEIGQERGDGTPGVEPIRSVKAMKRGNFCLVETVPEQTRRMLESAMRESEDGGA